MMILRRRHVDVLIEPAPTRLRGFFKLEAVRSDGRVRPLTDWFENLILDQGLDYIGSASSVANTLPDLMTTVVVGTSGVAPANTQTQLVSLLSSSSTDAPGVGGTRNAASSPYWMERTIAKRFAAGTATGTLAELGVGWGATTLLSRALVADPDGNPSPVTVLADEALDVYYTLRMYPTETDTAFSFVLDGVTRNGVARAARVGQIGTNAWKIGYAAGALAYTGGEGWGRIYSGDAALGAITAVPTATAAETINDANPAYGVYYPGSYVAGSHEKLVKYFFSSTVGNVAGGIGGMLSFDGMGVSQQVWTPAITKDVNKTMHLVRRMRWTRF